MCRFWKSQSNFYLLILFSISFFANSCKSHKEISKTEKYSTDLHLSTSGSKKIELKYAELLKVDKNNIQNIRLYSFIDSWYGTPYKYGGKNKKGIDCSNFTSTLYSDVYNKNISGTSASLFEQCKIVSKNNLKEGDLVFFKIEKDNVSHIGVYLQNNKFVHATTKKGVMIDDLDQAYYKKYYYKAGRIE